MSKVLFFRNIKNLYKIINWDTQRIMAIALENLVAQRQAGPRHHQGNAHLLAIAAFVPQIAILRLRIARDRPFKISARYIIEQQVVVDLFRRNAQ